MNENLYVACHRSQGREVRFVERRKGYYVFQVSEHVFTVIGSNAEHNLSGWQNVNNFLDKAAEIVPSEPKE